MLVSALSTDLLQIIHSGLVLILDCLLPLQDLHHPPLDPLAACILLCLKLVDALVMPLTPPAKFNVLLAWDSS